MLRRSVSARDVSFKEPEEELVCFRETRSLSAQALSPTSSTIPKHATVSPTDAPKVSPHPSPLGTVVDSGTFSPCRAVKGKHGREGNRLCVKTGEGNY